MSALRRLARSPSAASETVGTILLLVIAIALAGVFALTIFTLPPPLPSSHATLEAFTPPATDQLVIEHRGGPPIPLSALTATVTVNGTAQQFNVADGITAGTWTVMASDGKAKTRADSFAAGDQAIYTAPALWGAAASVTVINGATTGVGGAALALEPTTVQAADSVAPTFLSARTTSTTTIQANVSEPVRNLTAPDSPDSLSPTDFTVQVLGVSYSITGIHLLANGSAAELTVSPAMPSDALPWINATAAPKYVSDLAGNAFTPSASVRATDGVAPGISGVSSSSVTTGGATISWTTDEPATTSLVYSGPTPSLGFTAVAATGGTSHAATLTGLSDNQQYFYEVVSADASGNAAASSVLSFTTNQLPSSGGGGGADPSYLSLPTSLSLTSGSMSPALTVTLKNSTGAITATTPITVSLGTNSSVGSFFLDAAGTQPATSVTIAAGQSSATFYYRDYRDAGTSALTATAEGVISTTTVATVAQNSGHTFPYHLEFSALPTLPMGQNVDVSGFTVTLKDTFGNDVVPPWPMTVNLSTNSTLGYFVSPSSSAVITSVTLNGAASASFKYHDLRGGETTILAYANATQPASAGLTIVGSSNVFARLSLAQTWTAVQTYGSHMLNVTNLDTASGTLILPDGTDTLLARNSADTITGAKTFTTGSLRAVDLDDANGNKALVLVATPSAVNQITVTNGAAGSSPSLSASGSDANLNLNLVSKGSGNVLINGQAISLGGAFTTSGANAVTFATTGATSVTLPTSGTLTSTAGTLANHAVAVGQGGSSLATISTGSSGQPLVSAGSGADPAFGALNLAGGSGVVTGALPVGNGGTGATTLTAHGLLVGQGTSAVTATGTGASGQALLSTGSTTDPAYGALNLAGGSSVVTGTLPIANGGTGLASAGGTANRVLVTTDGSTWSAGQVNLNSAMVTGSIGVSTGGTGISTYTLGDTLYASGTTTLSKLPGNTAATKMFLSQTGTGSLSAAPSWTALSASDIPNLDASKIATGTISAARGGTGVDSSASTGVAHVSSGTWSFSSVVNGDIAANTITFSKLARTGTTGQPLLSGGTGGDAGYGALDLSSATAVTGTLATGNGGTGLTGFVKGDILYASSATALSRLPGNTASTTLFLTSTGTGSAANAPAWSTLNAAGVPTTSGTNTWTAAQTFNAGDFVVQNKFINILPALSSTQTTMTLPGTEPDTNYGVVCQSGGAWNGNANLIVISKTTTSFIVTYSKITSIGSPAQSIDCFVFR